MTYLSKVWNEEVKTHRSKVTQTDEGVASEMRVAGYPNWPSLHDGSLGYLPPRIDHNHAVRKQNLAFREQALEVRESPIVTLVGSGLRTAPDHEPRACLGRFVGPSNRFPPTLASLKIETPKPLRRGAMN